MSLENMSNRLQFCGGHAQNDRLIKGKLESLKRSLHASYQSANAILANGHEFKCLINPDKLKEDYDHKILSIPYDAPCLDDPSLGEIKTEVAAGDIIQWKQNGTYWLVYLQRLQELAYFRADLKRCKYEVDVNGETYRIATQFVTPPEATWETKEGIHWSNLNYTMYAYITKDDNTLDYFKRFAQIKINGQNWEVQAVDRLNIDGVIMMALKEYWTNTIAEEKALEEELNKEIEVPFDPDVTIYINGEKEVYPYDKITYTIENAAGGSWALSNTKAKITSQTDTEVSIEITSGKSGDFVLTYIRDGIAANIELPIKILSL